MSQLIDCPCGQRLRVPSSGAAQVRCPTCKTLRTLSDPEDEEPETHGILKEHVCPGCARRWEEAVAICIECGHDFRSGGKLRRRVAEKDTVVDMGISGFLTHVRFIVRRDTKGRWWLIRKKSFLFIGVGTMEFALADYSAVATDFRPTDDDGDGVSDLYLEGRGRSRWIWSGTRDDRMRDLLDLLHDGPGLAIRRK